MVPVSTPIGSGPRLAFCARSAGRGGVDGAWWPLDANLSAQLPDLVSILGLTIGEVSRVVYDPSVWPPTPSRIIKGSKAISVDPYPMVAADTIYLVGTHARDAVLYVIPPATITALVDRVLDAVSAATNGVNVSALRLLSGHYAPLVDTHGDVGMAHR
jgi:hypothetical protein